MLSIPDNSGHIFLLSAIGLALFLFGMQRLEVGLRALGLRTLQLWLTRATGSAFSSVITGTAVTALLQSSSLVSLLVLAFASAEILPLYNAVGIIIGANLGTTFTGWMVATIGFKLSMSTLTLPLMGAGAFMQWWSDRAPRIGAFGWLIFGIGMILFGLDVMRDATEQLTAELNMGALKGYGIAVYFLVGLLVAALIQSSSATMMLTLMALNSDLITLTAGAAIVIGANLGTTSTVVLASIGGSAVKRQLALAHFAFNTCVDIAALFVLLPLLPVMIHYVEIEDPLFLLVAFHSFFNLLGVLAFMPFLHPFTRWVGGRFKHQPNAALQLLSQPANVPDAAIVAIDRALLALAAEFALFALHALRLPSDTLKPTPRMQDAIDLALLERLDVDQRYRHVKSAESAIFGFSLNITQDQLSVEQRERLQAQLQLARAFAYSGKTLKDIRADMNEMESSPHKSVRDLYKRHRTYLQQTLASLYGLYESSSAELRPEELETLERGNEGHFNETSALVSELIVTGTITGEELSTLLNVNRDVHHAIKGLLRASHHWWLSPEIS